MGELNSEEPVTSESGLTGPLTGAMPYRGVNLAGAEFGIASDGTGGNPGTYGTTYTWPGPNSADYFLGKGMNTFRLPFRWERLQRTRRAAFDATELGRMRTTVNGITAKGGVVLLDPHNYARYGTALIGSSSVPNADFADFWSRLANEFKGNPRVLFGLMNEPYGLPTEQWVNAANAAIAAIRATGATNMILVPGNAWSGAHSWTQNWYGTANAVALLQIQDPGNNTAFEAHQYFDSNFSGTSDSCATSNAGSAQMGAFTNWLRANGKKGFLGEFAVGSSSTCLTALENLLTYLEANSDVYLGYTWWAAGPWWGNAWTSLEPTSGGADKPQMDVFERHLNRTPTTPSCTDGVRNGTETGVDCGGSCAACATCTDGVRNGTETGVDCGGSCAACAPAPSCTDGVRNGTETGVDCGGSCAACPIVGGGAGGGGGGTGAGGGGGTSCTSVTYEAESMTRTTGGSVSGGWNLWSNGSLQTTSSVTFSTAGALAVTARGSVASGVWPRMTVAVGATALGTVSVSSTAWAVYRFSVPAGASGTIRITFDNDARTSTEDRNLYVDKVVSECSSTGSTGGGTGSTGGGTGSTGGGSGSTGGGSGSTGGGGGTTACTGGATYEAETMTRSTGGSTSGGWNLWSNGYLSTRHTFTSAPTRIAVSARGSPAGGVYPRMRVSVGGALIGTVTVSSTTWREYTFDVTREAGTAELRVVFDNDAIVGGEDRNLYVDKVVVRCP